MGGSLCDGRAEQGVRFPSKKGTGYTEEGIWISGLEDVQELTRGKLSLVEEMTHEWSEARSMLGNYT